MAKKASKAHKKSAKVGAANNTGVTPLSDRVLVRREDMPDKKSVAGIVLPDSAQKDKSKMGVVLAVGPGRVSDSGAMIATTVKVGMKVFFNAGWDNEVAMGDDNEYFLVRESDILAVLK
jgi:chaperonin GroES